MVLNEDKTVSFNPLLPVILANTADPDQTPHFVVVSRPALFANDQVQVLNTEP